MEPKWQFHRNTPPRDIESRSQGQVNLVNESVGLFSWERLTVETKDKLSGRPITLINGCSGSVKAGEVLAIMGPSGSGKSTLLNTLSGRSVYPASMTTGGSSINGYHTTLNNIRKLSAYAGQEDTLTGSLTVVETLKFASDLAIPNVLTRSGRQSRIDALIDSMGLQAQTHTLVGTPLRNGLSGGQKKRLGIASKLVTAPKILFLDEPTSGLDSFMALDLLEYIRNVAKKNKIIVIMSVHQPSSNGFRCFDKLQLLCSGRTCFFGVASRAHEYFTRIGFAMPAMMNPAEFYLDLISSQFRDASNLSHDPHMIVSTWEGSGSDTALVAEIHQAAETERQAPEGGTMISQSVAAIVLTLLCRSWVKAYRDLLSYGIRAIMYLGLAVLMGTVFLRLGDSQENIQPFINAIFFGGAFMSFMAVAYVPAFIEDHVIFEQERADGLVGPFAFLLANFIIGLPFLFGITLLFSITSYWTIGFRNDAQAFMTWNLWLFLDLVAAESLVVLVSSIVPVFVVSLAITAFANGIWMCVGGFLVPYNVLNVFWKYSFHYADYQAYVFEAMMVNEFSHRNFTCAQDQDRSYVCMYGSSLNPEGKIAGKSVLESLEIRDGWQWIRLGAMLAVIVLLRFGAFLYLRFFRS